MLKIVPDPPFSPEMSHSLEDHLVQISERLFCALSIIHLHTPAHVTPLDRGLSLTTTHEIEAARQLAVLALSKLQVSTDQGENTMNDWTAGVTGFGHGDGEQPVYA